MFPWQSGASGREETPTLHLNPRSGRWLPDNSRLQRHVGLAVAYNTWQYYQATADLDFLAGPGAELIIEVAKFWASAATYDRADDRFDLRGVMGPDEYHDGYPWRDEPGVDNNAYTNVMAAWTLTKALDHAWTAAARAAPAGASRPTRRRPRRAGPLGPPQPQAAAVLARRRHPQPVRGVRPARASSTGSTTSSATATSPGSTASWRRRATPPTATRSPSRPTCSCCSTCCPRTSCTSC